MISSPTFVKVFSALDNEATLWPILTKDMIDNTGRSISEYKRGGKGANHAGRERLFEEFATTAAWLGGRKFLDYTVSDPAMRAFGLDPKIDTFQLFFNTNFISQGRPQGAPLQVWSAVGAPLVGALNSEDWYKNHGQYKYLPERLFKSTPNWFKSPKTAYFIATALKLIIGTLIPIFVIGWVIPTINQAITRKLVLKEKRGFQQQTKTQTPLPQPLAKGTSENLCRDYGNYPYNKPYSPNTINPFNPYYYPLLRNPQFSGNSEDDMRFGEGHSHVMAKLALLLKSDVWKTISIDGGISGGRLYKVRNWIEGMEVFIREASVILFIYFLGDFVKSHVKRFFDKKYGTATSLTIDSVKMLKNKSAIWIGRGKIPLKLWEADIELLKGLNQKNAFDTIYKLLNPLTGKFDRNPVFEIARLQRKITLLPLEKAQSADRSLQQKLLKLFNLGQGKRAGWIVDPREWLDIEAIKETMLGVKSVPPKCLFEKIVSTLRRWHILPAKESGLATELVKVMKKSDPNMFRKFLDRTLTCKSIALVSSYVVSAIFLSWLAPKFMHWLTYRLTGKVDFPGTREDVTRYS